MMPFLRSVSNISHKTYLAEMPVGWSLELVQNAKEHEISREEFEATPKKEVGPIFIEGKLRTLFEAI
jgi:phage FluMu gp28-like protein